VSAKATSKVRIIVYSFEFLLGAGGLDHVRGLVNAAP
jgi:hypothetical protein